MSTIRNQLEKARDEYQSARYPGDLAAELLSFRITAVPSVSDSTAGTAKALARHRWFWAGGTSSAAAAALIAAFMLSSRTQDLNLGTNLGTAPRSSQETAGFTFPTGRSASGFPFAAPNQPSHHWPSGGFEFAAGLAPSGNRFRLDRAGDGTIFAEFGTRSEEVSPFEFRSLPDGLSLQPVPRGQVPAGSR